MSKEYQQLAPNSTMGGGSDGYGGSAEDVRKLNSQSMKNTRANGYVTNQFAGGGVHSSKAKVKGGIEHGKQEDEFGNDYQ